MIVIRVRIVWSKGQENPKGLVGGVGLVASLSSCLYMVQYSYTEARCFELARVTSKSKKGFDMLDFFVNGLVDGVNVVGFGAWFAILLFFISGLTIFFFERCFALYRYIDSPNKYAIAQLDKAAELQKIDDLACKVEARRLELDDINRNIDALKN